MIEFREDRRTRRMLALVGVLAVVVGGVVWTRVMEPSGDESAGQTQVPADRVGTSDGHEGESPSALNVEPVVPAGHIVTASWHTNAATADSEEGAGEPERPDWNHVEDDAGGRARREGSLRGVLKQVGGLGIHVAREHNDDE